MFVEFLECSVVAWVVVFGMGIEKEGMEGYSCRAGMVLDTRLEEGRGGIVGIASMVGCTSGGRILGLATHRVVVPVSVPLVLLVPMMPTQRERILQGPWVFA